MNSGNRTLDEGTADANADPLTGEPGAHPVGVGVGSVAGGIAAGAAVGAIVGGLAGKGVAEGIDPTAEDAYWRENWQSRGYVAGGRGYDDYGPAYGYAVRQYEPGRSFEDVESDLADGWMGARGRSSLGWGEASPAARDAWDRLDTQRRPL